MARRKVRRRRGKPSAAVKQQEPEVVETAEAVEPEVVEKPSAARRRRRPRKVEPEVAEEALEHQRRVRRVTEAEDEPEAQVDAADTHPVGRTKQRRVRRVRKAEVEVPVAPEVPVELFSGKVTGESVTGDDAIKFLLSVLDAGEAIALRKVGGDFVLQKLGAVQAAAPVQAGAGAKRVRKMTTKDMRGIAYTDEYKEFDVWWPGLSFEEKVAEAEKEDITWDKHEDPLVNNLRLTLAYRKAFEIEKWKPEYASKKARDALLYGGAV